MKTAIVLAAYGASNLEGKHGLAFFEELCRKRFSGVPLRWAFTSERQRDRLAGQKRKSDSLYKAVMRLGFEQFDRAVIQPLHIIPGKEYEDILASIRLASSESPIHCQAGLPLISSHENIPAFASLLFKYAESLISANECAIFMAHGARHPAGALYGELAAELERLSSRIFLGAMSSPPYLADILPRLSKRDTWLIPLLSVAGLHALRDMAGETAVSWKNVIENCGITCHTHIKGLIEEPVFANLLLDNLEKALTGTSQ